MTHVQVGDKRVGDGFPTLVIAEMAWSHDGSHGNAATIIAAAAAAGADGINMHLTSLPDYMVRGYGAGKGRVSAGKDAEPIYGYLDRINLRPDDWRKLFALARARGLLTSAMCNDPASARLAAELQPDIVMVHASGIAEEPLVRACAALGRPLVLGIGGAWLGEVERAIGWARAEGNEQVILQYGFQSYPTQVEAMHLRFIATLKQLFGLPVGFGDHTDGGSELAITVPIVAAAMGANVIEKHLTHDRSLRGEDFESALDPGRFAAFVRQLRTVERGFGSAAHRPLSDAELRYRDVVRKRAVAARPIAAGEPVTAADVAFKRSDAGLYPDEFRVLAGRRAGRALQPDEPITAETLR